MWYLSYFLVHLAVYTLLRLEFLVWNWASIKSIGPSGILWAFINGLRFDLSALAATLGIAFIGLLWMSKDNLLRKLWIYSFLALNCFLLFFNVVDIELYSFAAKRFTVSAFFMAKEATVSSVIVPYLPLLIPSMLIIAGFLYFAYKNIKKFKNDLSLKFKVINTVFFLILAVILSRGGLQHKPLTFVDAKIFDNTYANNLVLNSTFTILKSATKKSIQRTRYFSNEEMLSYLNEQPDRRVVTPQEKLNIVVLVLESFSKEYIKLRNPEVTPFFNSLTEQGVYFENSYANARRSIEGIAAIMSGIPALMEEPFINSEFSANQIIGLGSILEARGYQTAFFHGTNSGSMHFDSFMKSVGIRHHYSANEYPNPKDHDGTWGIFDEPFLNWTCEKLSEHQAPFFSLIFTLSSHQPYKLPDQHVERFKDDRLQILKSIQYTDYSLQKFFECARKQTWFDKTLFILTADHTGPELRTDSSFVSRYEIPTLYYGPKLEWLSLIDKSQFVQQIDIAPSILDILNIEQKNVNYLSRSVLRSAPAKVIALYSDMRYELVGDLKNKENQLKAVQQYFSEGLYDNRLYYPLKSE